MNSLGESLPKLFHGLVYALACSVISHTDDHGIVRYSRHTINRTEYRQFETVTSYEARIIIQESKYTNIITCTMHT